MDGMLAAMALHRHLPDVAGLKACFASMKRVLRPNGRIYVYDLGRVKDLRSVAFLVKRAGFPGDEPLMERDYCSSLQAAFSKAEFSVALAEEFGGGLASIRGQCAISDLRQVRAGGNTEWTKKS